MEDEAVCEDGEERGEAFDGVDEGDRDDGCCSCGEDVPADLEKSKRERGVDDLASGSADAVFQRRYGGLQGWAKVGEICKQDTPGGYERELDESKSDWFRKGVQYRFRRRVGEG